MRGMERGDAKRCFSAGVASPAGTSIIIGNKCCQVAKNLAT